MNNENVTVNLFPEEDLTHWPYDYRYKLKCDIDMYHELSCEELKSDSLIIPMYNKLFRKYKDNIVSITELICILYMKTAESTLMKDYEAIGIYNTLLMETRDYLFDHYTSEDIEHCSQTVSKMFEYKEEK